MPISPVVSRTRMMLEPRRTLGLDVFPQYVPSKDLKEAKASVRSLYRRSYRTIPFILQNFRLKGLSIEEARARMKAKFYQHPHVGDDVLTIDTLRFRGEVDLFEFYRMYSTQSQIADFIMPRADRHVFFDRLPRRISLVEQDLEASKREGEEAAKVEEGELPRHRGTSPFLEAFLDKNINT